MKRKKNSKKGKKQNAPLIFGSVRWLLLIACCFLIVLSVGIMIYSTYFVTIPVQEKIVPYDFSVSGALGFNVEGDMMHFGQFLYTGRAERAFTLQNDFSSVVRISTRGDYAEYISFSDNDFVLPANTLKALNASLAIPDGLDFGNYSGEIVISFYRFE